MIRTNGNQQQRPRILTRLRLLRPAGRENTAQPNASPLCNLEVVCSQSNWDQQPPHALARLQLRQPAGHAETARKTLHTHHIATVNPAVACSYDRLRRKLGKRLRFYTCIVETQRRMPARGVPRGRSPAWLRLQHSPLAGANDFRARSAAGSSASDPDHHSQG